VALPLPVDRTFTYAVQGTPPPPGTRVLVPFRRRPRIGWVVGPGEPGPMPGLRTLLGVLESAPSVTPPLLDLTRWVADYYVVPHGLALRSALPSVLSDAARDALTLVPGADAVEVSLSPGAARLLDAMRAARGPLTVGGLRRAMGRELWPAIRELEAGGVLRHEVIPPSNPSVLTRKVARVARWLGTLEEREALGRRAPRQRACYEALEAAGGEEEVVRLEELGYSRAVVAGLAGRGLVTVDDAEVHRDPFREMPVGEASALTPTRDQAEAIGFLRRAVDDVDRRPVLLHGVTGSGKTLVYLELLEEVVVRRGRGAIVLVPEIALTPQTVSRFRARFGDRIAVLHSALSDGERYDAWRQLRSGERTIAVGARSALFAPVRDLGAIVVDEEHDGSYKQSESPRYHARDLAVVRAAREGAVCVLGSATPSLESWFNARNGKFTRLSLPERAPGGRLPSIRVVDLRTLRPGAEGGGKGDGGPRHTGTGGASRGIDGGVGPPGAPPLDSTGAARAEGGVILSADLVGAVRDRLRRREQVILLLNRRGYSSFVQCRECGDVRACPNCAVSLTYHRASGTVVCHHCRHEEAAPARCARCGSRDLSFRGVGTEQVERAVADTFPEARIARMDVDTTGGKWAHHEILGRVERGEVDILLGTQMIAKGLDFPRVTLVGVINADVGIHLPDFRASERTFQLLSQVAGRAGRGSLGGEVLIQTSIPEHYALRCALEHDYEGFAERELHERSSPRYPPLTRLANIVVSSPDEEAAAATAEAAVAWIRARLRGAARGGGGVASEPAVEVVGPAPAPIERLHGRWRWHFLLRAAASGPLGRVLRGFQVSFRSPVPGDIRIALDRDPVALL
jgi:primosomal protein N' (replication factor Y) (superfamily II helicase)